MDVQLASVRRRENSSQGGGDGGLRSPLLESCRWECRLVQLLWKTVWRFFKKLKIELPFHPAIPFLDIYPEKDKNFNLKRYVHPGVRCCRYSVAQSCLTLCNPVDCSTPGFPVHHHLPELLTLMSTCPVFPEALLTTAKTRNNLNVPQLRNG